MSDIFIGGCNARLALETTVPFKLEKRQLQNCEKRLLLDVNALIVAIHACNSCKLRTNPPRVEPTEINEFDVNIPPVVDNLGLDEEALFLQEALSEEDPEGKDSTPEIYKTIPKGAQDLTEDTASVDLPVPRQERKRKMEEIVNGAPHVSSILAPLPDFNHEKVTRKFEILEEVLKEYGSGPSLMGSSKLKVANHCLRRFFYKFILGLFMKKVQHDQDEEEDSNFAAVETGGLFHAVMFNHILTGGKDTWDPIYRVMNFRPTGALLVKSLIDNYFRAHFNYDAQMYDFRGVEIPSTFICDPRVVRGRKLALKLTTRHDALMHKMRVGERRAGPGEPTSSIQLRNYKTCRNLPKVSSAGLRTDRQTTLELFLAKFGHLEFPDFGIVEESVNTFFGNVLGIEYDYLMKVKKFKPSQHVKRYRFNVSDSQLAHQMVIIQDYLYEEIADRLYSKHWQDPATWTQSYWCHDVHYMGWLCPFHRLCDMTGASDIAMRAYDKDDSYVITHENLQYKGKPRSLAKQKKLKKAKLFEPAKGAVADKGE